MNRYQLLKTWPGLEWPNRTPSIVPTQRGQVMLQPVLQNSMTWVVPNQSPRLSKRRITSLTKSRKAFEFEHTPAMDFSAPLFLLSATVNWNGIDSFLILFRQSEIGRDVSRTWNRKIIPLKSGGWSTRRPMVMNRANHIG